MSDWHGRWRDTLTGWEGEACARTEHVGGYVELGLVRIDQEGKPDEQWFSVGRLRRPRSVGSKPAGFAK